MRRWLMAPVTHALTPPRYRGAMRTTVRRVSTPAPTLTSTGFFTQDKYGRARRSVVADAMLPHVRNVGIVAHIDAGKTTTTERMLYYAGAKARLGEVDRGTTTTDYMEEERERGITIQAAAVTVEWEGHVINLLDTPGHTDFAVEVERSMRVVDGVVALFDSAVGVQAQSYAILRQARRLRVPLMAFVNKMDKPMANLPKVVESIRSKLGVTPLLVQLPLRGESGEMEGVLDVVRGTCFSFQGREGQEVVCTPLDKSEYATMLQPSYQAARRALIEELTRRDDSFTTAWLNALESAGGDEVAADAAVSPEVVEAALRRVTLGTGDDATPVMAVTLGAARRNVGVQPLMSALCRYLPSPSDRRIEGCTLDGKERVALPAPSNFQPMHALVFKVAHIVHPKTKAVEPLAYFRVYTGRLLRGSVVRNAAGGPPLRIEALYALHADSLIDVPAIDAGCIGGVFLKGVFTGDTLVAPIAGEKKDFVSSTVLEGILIPAPVISFAVEAASHRQLDLLENALKKISLEDPSLRTSVNDAGQAILEGIGPLHLEITLSRLRREYQIKCSFSHALIAYREILTESTFHSGVELRNTEGHVLAVCDIELRPTYEDAVAIPPTSPCEVTVANGVLAAYCKENNAKVSEEVLKRRRAEFEGLREAFQRALDDCARLGPVAGFPFLGVRVELCGVCSVDGISFCDGDSVSIAAQKTLSGLFHYSAHCTLAEPMMKVTVHLSENEFAGTVVSLLQSREATMAEVVEDGGGIDAVAPMRNLVNFVSELRVASKGTAFFGIALNSFREVRQSSVLKGVLRQVGVR